MTFTRTLFALTLLLVGCAGGFIIFALSVDWPAWHLGGYQQQIDDSARIIAAAKTDAARAAGHVQRGRAYAEIVRYRHVMKLVGATDYMHLYDSAMKDLDAAIQLDPNNVEAFNARGLTYFERNWTVIENKFEPEDVAKIWLARAKADFTVTINRDARNAVALDYRGIVNEKQGDYVGAIDDYTRLTEIDPKLGKIRLADLYCRRGTTWLGEKQYDKAVADLEQSIALDANADGCDCDPYSPLLWTYLDGFGDFEKSWALVHKAQSNRHWLMPELVEKLKAKAPPFGASIK
jgi:tetratricopeptide (TPR) repeat protein